jgi:hypothetical protein
MTLRWLRHKGFWMFIASVAWYVAATFLNGEMPGKKMLTEIQIEQEFDINDASTLRLSLGQTCDYSCREMTFVLDPSAKQVKTVEKNIGMKITSQLNSDSLTLKIDKNGMRRSHQGKSFIMHIPLSIRRVEVSGSAMITLSGSNPQPDSTLHLIINNSTTHVATRKLQIHHLQLDFLGQRATEPLLNSSRFSTQKQDSASFDEATINNLDIRMLSGAFSYLSANIPQQANLHLGRQVNITATPAFIKNATITELQ